MTNKAELKPITKDVVKRFVKRILKIQRDYGYELKNVTADRQREVKKCMDEFVKQEFGDAN